MERIQDKWLERNARAEARLKRVFDFTNTEPAVVIVDCNYWTFGDLPEEIPDDHYTNPASAFKYQTEKIERHFHHLPEDDYIPFLHPWYGTGVLASAFGVNLVCNPKADPAVDLSTMTAPEEIDALELPVPGEAGAMKRVTDYLDYYKAHADLPVGITDCQGPLTTAFQIAGYDKFCFWMHDEPKRIHKLMEKVTEALIQWVHFQKERAGQPLQGCCYPLSVKVPDGYGGVWLSDDDSVIMSSGLYSEFVKPYNECVLKAFGGGCIHYCGQSTQNISNYVHTEGVRAIHNLNLDNISAAAAIRDALKEKGIVYMACDFAPSEQRMEAYYRELERAMGGPEGLIIASYIAPAIALDKGRYEAVSRDRAEVSRRVFGLLKRG